jgi:dTDP-4-amino-4,6-dideoxygalactose transaminase
MISTDDAGIAERCREIRQHGMRRRYYHDSLGYNFRMTDIHAAIGLAQMGKLKRFNQARTANARFLSQRLEGVTAPTVPEGRTHVFHQYTIRVPGERRDAMVVGLRERGVGVGVYYPVPIHQQSVYLEMGYDQQLPEAERAAQEVMSLPVHPGLDQADMNAIVVAVNAFAE